MTENYSNLIIAEIPALKEIREKLDSIEKRLEILISMIEAKEISKIESSQEKRMMTLKEISEVYSISLQSLRVKASKREIPLIKLGKRLYVDTADFEKWLQARKIKSLKSNIP